MATYGRRATFKGRIAPALRGAPITLYSGTTPLRSTKADKKGRFAFKVKQAVPATYAAHFDVVGSNAVAVPVRPALDVAMQRAGAVGRPLKLRAKLRPSGSGTMKVRIWRSGHELAAQTFGDHASLRLSTTRVANYKVRITVTPSGPFSPGRRPSARTSSCPTWRSGHAARASASSSDASPSSTTRLAASTASIRTTPPMRSSPSRR